MIPLEWYLLLAAALFCMGLYGVLSRRNGVAILMGGGPAVVYGSQALEAMEQFEAQETVRGNGHK